MEKLQLITGALGLIEAHLTQDLRTADLARALHCSKSSLEKLFRYTTGMSIRDYVIRRRMSRAARDIAASPDLSLLNLALRYGYGSNEAFTRAFRQVWHVTPSEYRKNPLRFELFPALRLDPELMEDETMTSKKKVDISELYDYIQQRRDCYFVGVDIKNLMPINDISHDAGDLAILTAMNRLEAACGADDIVFRIGGDEFVALTASADASYADSIAAEILSHNGEPFRYNGQPIPLTLHVTTYQLRSNPLKYADLFTQMQSQLDNIKH